MSNLNLYQVEDDNNLLIVVNQLPEGGFEIYFSRPEFGPYVFRKQRVKRWSQNNKDSNQYVVEIENDPASLMIFVGQKIRYDRRDFFYHEISENSPLYYQAVFYKPHDKIMLGLFDDQSHYYFLIEGDAVIDDYRQWRIFYGTQNIDTANIEAKLASSFRFEYVEDGKESGIKGHFKAELTNNGISTLWIPCKNSAIYAYFLNDETVIAPINLTQFSIEKDESSETYLLKILPD